LDILARIPCRAGQGDGVRACDRGVAEGGGFHADGHVFDVEIEPVESDVGHQHGGGGIRKGQPGANAGFTAFEFGFDVIGFHVLVIKSLRCRFT